MSRLNRWGDMLSKYRNKMKDVNIQFERLHPGLKAVYGVQGNAFLMQSEESGQRRRAEEGGQLEMARMLSSIKGRWDGVIIRLF